MTPLQALATFPSRTTALADGARVSYREAGSATEVTHVLLHGIGSASGSWVRQLEAAQAAQGKPVRVVAWDAPGYSGSTPVAAEWPCTDDYAQRVWAWLDALEARAPVTLVGHSLGALMAGRAALLAPSRVQRLVLLSPAGGYGKAEPAVREQKLKDRLATLERLGPQGMAQARGAAMLSPGAAPDLVEAVRDSMSQVIPAGYTQAARLLAQGTLADDVAQLRMPIAVASGNADSITTPLSCQAVAQAAGVAWNDLGVAGHACPLEAPGPVNALLGLH
ncbi:alpha/beta fold hydrolase [Hydrogenophaga sp. BPS33]|uniref:alpha/beta fold hydrolase n=1 Tax=Hydrogenophaga sp. BPS33 TaxID=2651974 RepID=UPI0013203DDE|nr:alpha/beta hydrolase [Hydrogenophaga sp. BPS33]QHE85526.1 alpha/beta hydrolase [Hydrogenophaga sp. BPS33]